MPVESGDEFATASSSPLSSYSGGDLAPSGSERRNAGECKEKEQEAHTDDTKDPDVAITTHIGDVEVMWRSMQLTLLKVSFSTEVTLQRCCFPLYP